MSALAKHVEESGQAAEFFVNKVLMEHRGTPHAAVRAPAGPPASHAAAPQCMCAKRPERHGRCCQSDAAAKLLRRVAILAGRVPARLCCLAALL